MEEWTAVAYIPFQELDQVRADGSPLLDRLIPKVESD